MEEEARNIRDAFSYALYLGKLLIKEQVQTCLLVYNHRYCLGEITNAVLI